ncbi:hypothetical protein QFZ74_003480 [Streptomyces sp. V3I7]|nr:hypothetical protein [Streptomyces sp. V3I7]
MVLRSLAAAAAMTAVVGAVVMRRWDIQAGKQVADLTRARASDEWQHEERVAELEADLEESREVRAKLEQRLRAKRTELSGLRNEHASLLRRYAQAETDRASALEGRRLLEIETAAPTRALPPGPSVTATTTTATANEEASDAEESATPAASPEQEQEQEQHEHEPASPAVFSPEGSRLFLRAKAALSRLDAGDDAAAETKGAAFEAAVAPATPARSVQEDEEQGQPEAVDEHERATAATTTAQDRSGQPVQPPEGHFTVPTAVAVVPASAPVRRPVDGSSFDFFGTKAEGASDDADSVRNEDPADVVGDETRAVHKAESEAAYKPAGASPRGVGQVIDLTVHDETEAIDVQGLHSAAS